MDRFIKHTKSLCPVCLDEIDAGLFIEDGKAVIAKECKAHGAFHGVVDPEGELYLKTVAKRRRRYSPLYALVLPVTKQCNLNCKWCYLPDREQEEEISVEKIKEIIDSCQHCYIVFSGGEPTLRKDLFSLITYTRRRHPEKFTVLLTNGVKLVDATYVKELKRAGLQYVIISFNGFCQKTHEYLSNRDLIDCKLKALRNLKKFKMWTSLSMTLAKGVNESEFFKVYRYAMRNIAFIWQIRLRNVSQIGIYKEGEHIYLTDMIKLVSRVTGFSIDQMCRSNSDNNAVFKQGTYFALDVFKTLNRLCGRSLWGRIRYWVAVGRLTGIINALRMYFEPPPPKKMHWRFRIQIFSWPTPGNIDLGECRMARIEHLTDSGEILPFLEALYKNERKFLKTEDAK